MLYPLTFHPVFKERVWGGRNLERLYQKNLPPNAAIGESWEITDRPEGVSVIANGPLAGKDLRWLMERHAIELLGSTQSRAGRLPLLIKILDAEEKLSLQVHPPATVADRLGGEPKTEMWFIASAKPGAELYVGLRRGVTRAEFERRIKDGTVAECFHRLSVRSGDAMFLPSGRVHGIGAGNVIFEIQQNSDTTYRVFDWHRVGLDGKPREQHVEQSLQCIDFDDFEPALVRSENHVADGDGSVRRNLVKDPLFTVDYVRFARGQPGGIRSDQLEIVGVLEGRMVVTGGDQEIRLRAGQFCLKPAGLGEMTLSLQPPVSYLHIGPGSPRSMRPVP
jgi:mannose-6-phosphate isomerase